MRCGKKKIKIFNHLINTKFYLIIFTTSKKKQISNIHSIPNKNTYKPEKLFENNYLQVALTSFVATVKTSHKIMGLHVKGDCKWKWHVTVHYLRGNGRDYHINLRREARARHTVTAGGAVRQPRILVALHVTLHKTTAAGIR